MSKKIPFTAVSPESVGVSSRWILDMLDAFDVRNMNMHSFLMIRHGKILAEGYWKPFSKNLTHRMYSITKTFAATAVGLLVDDGRISLDDKIADYFPDMVPADVHPWTAKATIRNLLCMSSQRIRTSYGSLEYPNWTESFFVAPPEKEPGTCFHYDTSASHTLTALVERITGKSLTAFLQERIFSEIGFSGTNWCLTAPEGVCWGGSAMLATPRDLARLALLYLNDGNWNGKQLLSEQWCREATSKQIDNGDEQDGATHGYGYGYQIWRARGNTFAFVGMGDQFAICSREHDAVFVCTADHQDNRVEYRLGLFEEVFTHFFDKLDAEELPEDPAAYLALRRRCENLIPLPVPGAMTSNTMKKVDGVRYELDENPMGIKSFVLNFDNAAQEVRFDYDTVRGEKSLTYRFGGRMDQDFPEEHYWGVCMTVPVNRCYTCQTGAAWDGETLVLKAWITDMYFGTTTARFTFTEDGVKLVMTKAAEWFLDEYNGEACGKKA